MIESDYNKWLKVKSKIENFDKISETNKKGIYDAEQELTGNESVNFVKVDYFSGDEEYDEAFTYYFEWIGYDEEIKRVSSELGFSEDSVEEIVEMGGNDMIIEILHNFIDLNGEDEIFMN